MELGNICFGHSRGNYPMPRSSGWEEELFRLFKAIEPNNKDDFGLSYGVRFENETFFTTPYFWGDCQCGFDEKDYKWFEDNKHRDYCYQNKKKEIEKEWAIQTGKLKEFEKDGYFSEYSLSDKDQKLFNNQIKKLCKEMQLTYPSGCVVHCTCDHDKNYNKWRETNNHDPRCPIVMPNFWYKPMDLTIMWYKYPLRDSYISHQITLKEFKQIIDKCIESLKNEKQK
jgi:hypothetical protein